MGIAQMLDKVGGSMLFRRKVEAINPPVLSNGHRVPYGPFSFRASLSPHGAAYTVLASTNLTNWVTVATNTFDTNGLSTFTFFNTNTFFSTNISTNLPQIFFRTSLP